MTRTRPRGRSSGSVLMLVPAAVLVLLVLGAIAVDSAVVLLAQRDLTNRTAAASNDIAGSAVDDTAFYSGGGAVALDDVKAQAYVRLAFADDRRPAGYTSWTGQATVDGRSVEVAASATVKLVFAPAIVGAHPTAHVAARSVATARGG